jgi:phenylalanyl-tRNA synthetase alpha chain
MSGIDIEAIKNSLGVELEKIASLRELEEVRVKYLGRKGVLAQLTGSIPTLPVEQRPVFGQEVNALKNEISALIEEKKSSLVKNETIPGKPLHLAAAVLQPAACTTIDIGLPAVAQEVGRLHPITQVMDEICGLFGRMGFCIVEGPEVETEYNNFTGLNIPLEHPSRDAFDTFYVKNAPKLLLRSHTSPVQVRAMKAAKPPLAMVVPGRVYRPDAVDASHSFMFHQVEGFMVDRDIRLSDLKGVLEFFAKGIFGQDITMRFRPHFFPFTEPSAEMDISCKICKGGGCSVCGRKGWLEILGSGMIHPNVLRNVGYDPDIYTGFAFGMGVERIAMLKYGIDDIRLFYENDLRFLAQF